MPVHRSNIICLNVTCLLGMPVHRSNSICLNVTCLLGMPVHRSNSIGATVITPNIYMCDEAVCSERQY